MLTVKWAGPHFFGSMDAMELKSIGETRGVYIIWYKPPNPNLAVIVRLGQGDIAARIADHQRDEEITAYSSKGMLRVIYAPLPNNAMDGAESYLADKLNPLVGERFPDVYPTEINLPWDILNT